MSLSLCCAVLKRLVRAPSICNSAPSEILSLIALRNQDKILAKNTAIVRHNFALLQSLLVCHLPARIFAAV